MATNKKKEEALLQPQAETSAQAQQPAYSTDGLNRM